MTTLPNFDTLSVKGLQGIAGILTGKTPARSESKASATARVAKLLALESDVITVLYNLPSLMASRGYRADATALESALDAMPESAHAPAAPAPVVDAAAESMPESAPIVDAPTYPNPIAALRAAMGAAPADESGPVDVPAPVAPVDVPPMDGPAAPSAIDAWHARVGAAVAAAQARKAVVAAAVPAPKPAGKPNLPKPGTKTRAVFDAMCRPEGVSNKECCEMTGIWASWAVDGRKFAARYNLDFVNVRDGRGVRFFLSAPVDAAAMAPCPGPVDGAVGAPMPESVDDAAPAESNIVPFGARMNDTVADCMA